MERIQTWTQTLMWLLLSMGPVWTKPSEYQLDQTISPCERLRDSDTGPGLHCNVDGDFSPVQCSGGQCWCVDPEGLELNGTRTQDQDPHCASRCQLQSVLRCSTSGRFEALQCDTSRRQCWCVDQDTGREIYGTRTNQRGRPQSCPGPCAVLSRGLLHTSSPGAPPLCSDDEHFLPVQCRFINSSDGSEMDLTSSFSRAPQAFDSFSGFRSFFPDVSAFCFCVDRRGREEGGTGLELLMDQVYDSAFSGLKSGRTFSDSNIYRVLKRRLLGVQLVLTGNYRCPSLCESVGGSCDADGSFSSTQCHQGQCWCVDSEGRETPGTRASPERVRCGSRSSCASQRRSALLQLFSSPPQSSPPPPPRSFCSSLLLSLSNLVSDPVSPQSSPEELLRSLLQVLDGLFVSVDSALKAFGRSSPQRFAENLFGGKFLKMVSQGDLSAVGTKGPALDRIRSESGLHTDQVQTLIRVLEDPGLLSLLRVSLKEADPKRTVREALSPLLLCLSSSSSSSSSSVFVPRCSSSGDFAPVQCDGVECWCVELDGQEVDRTRVRGSRSRCPSPCERQRSAALRLQGALSAGAELHIPACSEDGHFLSLQCVGEGCFCVDQSGARTGLSDCHSATPQRETGSCAAAAAEVLAFEEEVTSLVALSSSSHFPLGLGFLLARGFRFTTEINQSEPPLLQLLSDNRQSALQLAAVSVYQQQVALQTFRTFRTFRPQCDTRGAWIPTQCDTSTGQCWCVGEDGRTVPGSLTNRRAPQCGSRPSNARAQMLLADWQRPDGSASYMDEQNSESDALSVQISQPLQTWSWSQSWSWIQSCSKSSSVESLLFQALATRALCSAQAPVSSRTLSLCDGTTVGLHCDQDSVDLVLTWTLHLSELRPEDLPDLHTPDQYLSWSQYSVESEKGAESAVFLNSTHFLEEVQSILGNLMMSQIMSELRLVTVTSPEFGCTPGFSLSAKKDACVLCPPGSFSSKGACLLCPSGTYQDEEGRDFCVTCPRGSSVIGASSVHQCQTECQQQRGRCSDSGDFLPAQPDFLSRIWGCVTKEGAWLQWTNSETPLTDKECTALSNFRLLSDAEVQSGSEAVVLRTATPERTLCLKECALSASCHHVALWSDRCELYDTSEENTDCSTATVTKGFLGNPEVEHFDWLRCAVKVRGGASGRQVFRKTGDRYSSGSQSEYSTSDHVTLKRAESGVYRTLVFSANQSTRSDVQRFCLSTCRRDACCEGYVLNENRINNGSIMCGLLHSPSVLLCSDQDWDVIGRGAANRDCGVGFEYNKKQGNFLFDIGGPALLLSRSDVALDQMDDVKYQASLVSFSSVQLESEPKLKSSGSCSSPESGPESGLPVDPSVRSRFQPLSVEQVKVTPQKQPSLTFWFNKRNYSSQDALLSCLQRCLSEPLCSVADILDLHSDFFFCELFPNTAVCGDYANPERQQCLPLLSRAPNNTYIKTVDLSGPVKSFYQRVPFRKMVSYSVRTRIQVLETSSVSQSFRECERRCDEDHCCRGFGLIRDPKTGSGPGLVCLPLISLGVLTCPENQTQWTTQDCSPSPLLASPLPLGWYQKPVDQWSSSPSLCPDFRLPQTRTVLNRTMWSPISGPAQLLVDPALNTYDIIHLSRDIIEDREKALDWCLHACQESSSCFAVAFLLSASGGRCLLYPDTRVCSSASCQLVLREPAHQVYVRPADRVQPQTLDLPGSRSLRGQTVDVVLDSDRTRSVVQFLGVPFARPPIGALRFAPAQPSDWTGTWNATKPRPSCVEPGRESGASEDCLYLNVFTPRNQRGALPVLVYFYNSPAGFLDGSLLSARGDLVVVSAQYRSSALGFALSDAGLSDQGAVLQWVSAHIHLVGGAKDRVTAGAERQGADMLSTHLQLPGQPLFNRLLLMGGSVFSPSLLRSDSQTLSLDLARELGCDIMDADRVTRCLQETDLTRLNQAQTRILARTGPLTAWGPVLRPEQDLDRGLHRVDLLLGTSETDGLISRARTIKKFEELSGRTDSKTVFYEALVRSLGLESDRNQTTGPNRAILKEAASWLYSLDHSPSPSSYNLFSRALDNATRDLFVVCPSLKMAEVFAQTEANVYLYHVPATNTRADVHIPIDVQFLFGGPLHPISSQRFTAAERKMSEAMMSYVTQFIKTGDPNLSRLLPECVLPRWGRVLPTETTPTYLELSPTPRSTRGLRPVQCSFWNQLVPKLRGEPEAEPVLIAPPLSSVGQSQAEKDGYS